MPRRSHAVSLLAVSIALALGAAACKHETPPPAGDIAASLTLPTVDGAAFDPATLRGKPAVVVFWRTGCKYCMNELPRVSKLAETHGVAAVAVMIHGTHQGAVNIQHTFSGTVLEDDGTLRDLYKVKAVPYTLVLRGDGTAAHAYVGEQSEATLRDAIASVK